MYEFDSALHHSIEVKRKKRLIAMMAMDPGDIFDNDDSNMAALRQHLRQYTYIDYTAGDWLDKLLYALPLLGLNDQDRIDQERLNAEHADALPLQ